MLRLRQSQSLRVQQRLEQMLKLKLSQELRLVLRQILQLLQALRLTQKLDLELLETLNESLSGMSHREINDLAHEATRIRGRHPAEELYQFLLLAPTTQEFHEVHRFAHELRQIVRRERRHCGDFGPGLAFLNPLRLRLRLKPWEPGETSAGDLSELLEAVPQRNVMGTVEWVLAGGWAVHLLVGYADRSHHDIDTLTVAAGNPIVESSTDNRTCDNYFGSIKVKTRFVRTRCIRYCKWKLPNHGVVRVAVLAPEFLFLSKFMIPPRPQDWADVESLVKRFARTWDLKLMAAIIDRNICDFTRKRELLKILRLRNPEEILGLLGQWGLQ